MRKEGERVKKRKSNDGGGGGTQWQYNNMIIRRAAPVFCSSCRRFGGSDRTDEEGPSWRSGALSRMVLVVVRQVGWGVAGVEEGIRRKRRAHFAGPVPGVHNMSVRKKWKNMERRKKEKMRKRKRDGGREGKRGPLL